MATFDGYVVLSRLCLINGEWYSGSVVALSTLLNLYSYKPDSSKYLAEADIRFISIKNSSPTKGSHRDTDSASLGLTATGICLQ